MSDQEPGRVFFRPEDTDENRIAGSRGGAIDYAIPLIPDQLSLWLHNAPTLSSIPVEDQYHEAARYILSDLSSFEVTPPLPLQQLKPAEIPHSKSIILDDIERGESSGTKRKHVSYPGLEMQTTETDEAGAERDPEKVDKREQPRRRHSTEAQKLYQRLQRQRFNEKMKALQEIIPNCNKRDQASILDDAIKYIKNLQSQLQLLQMMSVGAVYSMFHSQLMMMMRTMMMMMPQPEQQGMRSPNILAPFLQTSDGTRTSMGSSGLFSSFNVPMGLPNPCLPAPDAASTRSRIPRNFREPLSLNPSSPSSSSLIDCTPSCATSSGFQSKTGGERGDASGSKNEKCPIIPVIAEHSCTRTGGSSAGVPPRQIVLPHFVEDYDTTHSGSSEWFFLDFPSSWDS